MVPGANGGWRGSGLVWVPAVARGFERETADESQALAWVPEAGDPRHPAPEEEAESGRLPDGDVGAIRALVLFCPMSNDKGTTGKELVSQTLKQAVELGGLVATALGSASPMGAVSTVRTAAAYLLKARDKKRDEKRQQRGELIIQSLHGRVAEVEKLLNEKNADRIDLFTEIVNNAIDEDDAAKVRFHVGLVDWYVAGKVPIASIRLIGIAIRDLASFELDTLVGWHRTDGFSDTNLPLSRDQIWRRWFYHGLVSVEGAIMHGAQTPVLRGYLNHVPDTLPDPLSQT